MSRTRITTLPFLLLALSPFVIFDSDYALISCLLCKSNTLWNIFMGYLVEMKNRMRPCITYKNVNSGSLTFGVISLCFGFEIDFVSAL